MERQGRRDRVVVEEDVLLAICEMHQYLKRTSWGEMKVATE